MDCYLVNIQSIPCSFVMSKFTSNRILRVIFSDLNSCFEYLICTYRLFEMGFAQQLHEILNRLPDSRYFKAFKGLVHR